MSIDTKLIIVSGAFLLVTIIQIGIGLILNQRIEQVLERVRHLERLTGGLT